MKTINVLLAGTDRRTNNLVQTVVLDVCYNRAAVNCIQTGRLDELLARGGREGFDLIVIASGHLCPEPSRRSKAVSSSEVAQVLRAIKSQRSVPIIAVAVTAQEHTALLQGGADGVLGTPLNGDALRAEVARLLPLPQLEQEAEPTRGSVFSLLLRGLQLGKAKS